LENLKADLRAFDTIKEQYAERYAMQTQRQAHYNILTTQLAVRESTASAKMDDTDNTYALMNSKLIVSVFAPKRSSRKSESHTNKNRKAPGGSTKSCRSDTENWLPYVESEISTIHIRKKQWK